MALFRVLRWDPIFIYIDNHIKVMQQKTKLCQLFYLESLKARHAFSYLVTTIIGYEVLRG